MVPRVRERVPTPENDSRMNINSTSNNNPFTLPSISSSVALATSQLATNPTIFPSSNNSVPILGTLLLSPIKESDSVNNTLSSGSLATMTSTKSILPLNITSTNAQFGSLVIPANSNQDLENFVMIPTTTTITQNENELIPVHTVPLAITTTASQTSAVITDLPVDQTDSMRSRGATPRLENLFGDVTASPALKNKIERQQSLDSENIATSVDNNSNSSNSTLSRRPANVNGKNGEVYV